MMTISHLQEQIADSIKRHMEKPKNRSAGQMLSDVLSFIEGRGIRGPIEEYTDSLVADIRKEVSLAKILREKE